MQLLSRRDALRVICAPSCYGKTMVAVQYAEQVFAAEHIAWIDASELPFLIALDAAASDEFTAQYLEGKAQCTLFVVDGCPHLSAPRFEALEKMVKLLLDVGHEVLITTVDVRWAKREGQSALVVCARELLLDEEEQACWRREEAKLSEGSESKAAPLDGSSSQGSLHGSTRSSSADQAEGFDLSVVPGFRRAKVPAHKALFRSLVKTRIHDEQDAIAHLAILLGSGALHELTTFVHSVPTNTIVHLEQHVPHCGVKRLDPMFHAAPLSNDDKFSMVQSQLSALTNILPKFTNEDELIAALVDCFMRRGEELLATQLVCGLHDNDRKAQYFDRYGQKLLLETRPLALLRLASSLPQSVLDTFERWQLVILSLATIGDGKQAKMALDALQRRFQDEESDPHGDPSSHGNPSPHGDLDPHEEPVSHGDRVRHRSNVTHAPTRCAVELFVSLARIVFEIEPDHDPESLLPCVRERLEEVRVRQVYGTSSLTYLSDTLELIEQTLVEPYKAFVLLERFGARGYTVKECLSVAALFVQLLIHFWSTQLLSKEEQIESGDRRRTSRTKSRARKESELLERLEDHLARLLARQETTLPANSYELFLFEKAQRVFGERVYLFVGDDLLQRIEAGRTSLIGQRRQWRAQQATGALDLAASDKKGGRSMKKGQEKLLRINTLGRFEIEARDPSITIQNKVRKQLRLLISLLAINEGREVSRPWIQRVMWPEAPERNARQNLYSMWSLLNKSITNKAGECPFFESFPQSIAINESLVETDIHVLADLCKQLRSETLETREYEVILDELEDVYRGPLLPGVETAEVVAYRKRYQDHLLDALIQSGLHLRKQGKTTLALRFFQFAFTNEPTREDVCYQLMLALWKLGRHGEALNEYFVCRRALIDEFGVEGTARLRELYESILRDVS
ncbi:AfsR/SARP family transcriptional regulator [Anaerotardibacter muris]|uniref:AfsR/SARP family transcriptional regulator n=1 Tax=Anaerotardibacter muris TaxID=2941505 RepID=UPI00203F8F05|nr:bacterial transcriptional activator domain-containing protein [Anaerotardibacter muris]